MEIMTKPYGSVTINPDDTIYFNNGLLGFEDYKKYVLLGIPDVGELMVWLQSVEKENIAFPVIQPRFFWPEYRPVVNVNDLEKLEIADSLDALVYAIVVIPEDAKKMTANLRAPLIINVKNNRGKQIVLPDDTYKIKDYILGTNKEE